MLPVNDQPIPDPITLRVKHLVALNGLRQRDLLAPLHLSQGSLGNKYTLRTGWTVNDLLNLADLFGVSLDYLVGREPMESAVPLRNRIPVAGAGLEPAASRL